MLKRVHVKGYKSLADVEVGARAASRAVRTERLGKSNFLDALRLLSMVGTSRTLRDAFDSPYRGTPIESFHMGREGIEGLSAQERLAFSIEADLRLSESTLTAVDRQVRDMRGSARRPASRNADRQREAVHAHNLRYRIEIEMLPRSGALRVADEYLAPLTTRGEPSRRRPFLERQGDKLLLRREGGTRVTHHDRFLDHSILSMPHYPPHHPHLVAARHELESWLFFYFEPRERMRAANPLKERRRIGPAGEDLAAFLNTVKADQPELFDCVERELTSMMPRFDGIQIEVNDIGEVELRLTERGVAIPAGLLSGRHVAPARARGPDRRRRAPGPRRHRGAGDRRASAPDPDDRRDAGNPIPLLRRSAHPARRHHPRPVPARSGAEPLPVRGPAHGEHERRDPHRSVLHVEGIEAPARRPCRAKRRSGIHANLGAHRAR